MEATARYMPPSETEPLTVKPVTSCATVARALASLEVGDYADGDQLRVAAGTWEQSCVKQRLTIGELTCLDDASDQLTIAYCVPRWFPAQAMAILDPAACKVVANNIARRFAWQLQNQPMPKQARLAVAALQTSCERDRWPEELAACASDKAYLADLNSAIPRALDACLPSIPAPVKRMIDDRIAQAVRANH